MKLNARKKNILVTVKIPGGFTSKYCNRKKCFVSFVKKLCHTINFEKNDRIQNLNFVNSYVVRQYVYHMVYEKLQQ